MAKGSIMLQIAVEQIFSAPVHDVPEVWTVVFATLAISTGRRVGSHVYLDERFLRPATSGGGDGDSAHR